MRCGGHATLSFAIVFYGVIFERGCLFVSCCLVLSDNIFTLDVMEEPVIATDGFTYEKRF